MKLARVVTALLLTASTASAQQTQVDLLPYVNDALTTGGYCCSAGAYPTSGMGTNLGVTFSLASDANLQDAWRAELATNRTLVLPINMTVGSVYTLIDTRFGYAGDPNDPATAQASVTFNFSGGGSYTGYLFGCFNIRDHNPNGYSAGCWAQDAASPAGSMAQQWGSYDNGNGAVVFDMQTWDLSGFAGQTLEDITFVDNGPGREHHVPARRDRGRWRHRHP